MEKRELLTCSYCEQQFEELDSNGMCDECADDHVTCDHCGTLAHKDETHVAYESDSCVEITICQGCFDERTFHCGRCHETIIGNSYTVDGDDWCERCAERHSAVCDRCESHTTDTVTVECQYGAEEWCYACADNRSIVCCECGIRHDEDIDCPECGGESSGGIKSYNYKPRPTFVGTGDRFFGVELEIEAISGAGAFDIPESDDYSNVYYKHDGSLSNGYEIVTHPHTLDAFYASYAGKFGLFGVIHALQEKARSHNTSTCGLHIHVSRPSPMTVAKMVSFFAANIHAFEVLCRRKAGQYCKLNDIPMVDKDSSDLVCGSSRYGAIADRGCTIELRLPKGTLKASTVMATIEMYDALIKYCETTPVMGLNICGFLALCGTYKYLSKYDRYIKLMTDGAPDRCKPRKEIIKPKPPVLTGSRSSFDFTPPPACATSVNQEGIRIDFDAGGYPIGTPASSAFFAISTTRMEEYRDELVECANMIAGAVGFLSSYSIIDAVLIATVNKFSALGWDIDRICDLVIPIGKVQRVREIFSDVQ